MKVTIELDTVVNTHEGETLDSVARQLGADVDVEVDVADDSGRANGHPVLRWTGEPAALREICRRYGGDALELIYDPEMVETLNGN